MLEWPLIENLPHKFVNIWTLEFTKENWITVMTPPASWLRCHANILKIFPKLQENPSTSTKISRWDPPGTQIDQSPRVVANVAQSHFTESRRFISTFWWRHTSSLHHAYICVCLSRGHQGRKRTPIIPVSICGNTFVHWVVLPPCCVDIRLYIDTHPPPPATTPTPPHPHPLYPPSNTESLVRTFRNKRT